MLKFYYKDPTLPLEWGIRPIKEECPDLCVVDLQNCHRIFDVPVNIYVEEEEAEPLQAIDSQGNPIEKKQEEEIRFLLEGIDFEELGGNEIEGDGRKDFQNITEKGKRKLYERFLNESSSEFDDSSDEDYVQSDPSKKDLIKKLKKVLKDKKNRQEQKKTRETESEKHEWASEDEAEDDLVSLEGSEGSATEKHPVFKKSASMKNLNLVVGMKFENAAQFRGVLRDWCIRNGVDLEFLRNEAARVTAKCKSCEWRIHASPIQGGPTFQIKTIKGEHTCARTYDNKLANASYIAKRIENAIRDHPTIPVQQLKNKILSKCNVDVSRFKVMRAKKEALERIRGDDAKQYELLWDYCETVRKCNPGSKLLLRKVENSDPPVFDRILWGQLLVAVGRDGNDNMFPIAMAVVQVENRDTWAIGSKRARLDDYVDDCYTKSVYLKVYDEMIHAVPGAQDYIKTNFQPFKLQRLKKKRGMPKKLRRKGPNELQSKTSTRKGLTHTCTRCLQTGHNKHNCKNEVHPKSKSLKSNVAVHEEIPQGSQAPSLEPRATKCKGCSKRKKTKPTNNTTTCTKICNPGCNTTTCTNAAASRLSRPQKCILIGNVNPASSSVPATRRYNKRPSISEILDKMKERQREDNKIS
ncbi:hypothetical protein Sango_0783100 [Sesamum angolense]|uniref:Transposase MuDR plant domain-containing protein n=1 Tax=Sesamum angolense TaxID=2727404 RepID=A0AAE1X2Q0_9LAMI|nr:hypothetical protein Sango_0783100 [Sesamum angolense]